MNVTLETLHEEIGATPDSHHVECVRCHPDRAPEIRAVHSTIPIFTHDSYGIDEIILVRRRGQHPGTPPEPCDGVPYP